MFFVYLLQAGERNLFTSFSHNLGSTFQSIPVAHNIQSVQVFDFSLYFCSCLQDGSLQNGDHLLAIGDVRLWGMGAEQVAAILRQAGQDSIRLVVARPVDPTVPNYLVRTLLISAKAIKRSDVSPCPVIICGPRFPSL